MFNAVTETLDGSLVAATGPFPTYGSCWDFLIAVIPYLDWIGLAAHSCQWTGLS